jgi:MFS family permease
MREALHYLAGAPRIWIPMTLLFFVATFGMNFQVTTALMSRGVFHTGAGAFGLASTAYAAGALVGALLAARRRRPSARLQIAVALAFGLLETASGLIPAYWAFLLVLLPTGLSVVLYTTAANSATQLGTDPRIRGRVMGVYMLVFLGGAPIGSPLIGWVAEQFGPRMSLISGGVISAIAAVLAGIVLNRVTGTSARDGLRPLAPFRLGGHRSPAPAPHAGPQLSAPEAGPQAAA